MSNIARHIEAKHPEYGYWLRELIDEPPHDGDRL